MAAFRKSDVTMSSVCDDKETIRGFRNKTWSMLYAERLKNLGRFSIYLNVDRIQNETGYSNIRVQVETNSVSITTGRGRGRGREWTWKLGIPDVTFHPASCRGLKCSQSGELHCTLQTTLPNLLLSPTRTPSVSNTLQSHMVDSLLLQQDRCSCRFCGRKILPANRKFKRILPLPSEAWTELSGNHFCHKHDTKPRRNTRSQQMMSSQGLLLPKPGDCLVGDLYFLVNSLDVDHNALTVEPQTAQILCKRCRKELGATLRPTEDASEFDSEKFVCKIYSYSINMLPPTDDTGEPLNCINRWTFTEESYLANYLSEQSRTYTSFKFIIESSKTANQPTMTCLVWLLDSIQVYELTDIPTAAEHKHVHELSLEPEMRQKILYRGKIDGLPRTSSKQKNVDDEVFDLWLNDPSVLHLTLSFRLTTSLIQILASSTNSLPLSCRKINEFNVGFLRPP